MGGYGPIIFYGVQLSPENLPDYDQLEEEAEIKIVKPYDGTGNDYIFAVVRRTKSELHTGVVYMKMANSIKEYDDELTEFITRHGLKVNAYMGWHVAIDEIY
jgi:hypothetical protein